MCVCAVHLMCFGDGVNVVIIRADTPVDWKSCVTTTWLYFSMKMGVRKKTILIIYCSTEVTPVSYPYIKIRFVSYTLHRHHRFSTFLNAAKPLQVVLSPTNCSG